MGTGKVILLVKDGKIGSEMRMENISQGEMGMLISEMELLKQDLLIKYDLNRKRFNRKE